MRLFLIIAASIMLQGCISSNILVTMENRPEPLKGMASATPISGTFYAEDSKGLLCSGVYESLEMRPRFRIDVQCSDSRTGTVNLDLCGKYLQHGTGEGELNDGTTFNVYLGNEARKLTDTD